MAFWALAQNSTVGFGCEQISIVERVKAEPAVHTRPLGEASGERKVRGSTCRMAALMAHRGSVAGVAASSRWSDAADSEAPGVNHMTRRAFSCTAMLRE